MTSKSVHSATEIIQVDTKCINCSYILHTLLYWQSLENLMLHSPMHGMCSDKGFLHLYAVYLLYNYSLKTTKLSNTGNWTWWQFCLACCLWSVLLDMDEENYNPGWKYEHTDRSAQKLANFPLKCINWSQKGISFSLNPVSVLCLLYVLNNNCLQTYHMYISWKSQGPSDRERTSIRIDHRTN